MMDHSKQSMMTFIEDLFPICRSITGEGVRETLRRMQEIVPLEMAEIPSGTKVFDWTVPREWNIRDAYLESADGQRIVDYSNNNLHVMSYSTPVNRELQLDELQEHLYSLPGQPDLVPYRTSYYNENWGFCLSHNQRESLTPGKYHAVIDSELSNGSLTLGELFIPGSSDNEVLVYSHVCHPSLANDNLSGLAVTTWWAKHLLESGGNRHSFRFVWGPGTIGSITWLASNEAKLERINHGLVVVLVGRPGSFHFKQSRSAQATIDRVAAEILHETESGVEIRPFEPYGYDERQFCSPGINLPVGRLSRVPNGEFSEYHTSADNLALITQEALDETLSACIQIGCSLDENRTYVNQAPMCEPQLGKRGLYRNTGGDSPKEREYAMLWLLNLSDGKHSLQDIAARSGLPLDALFRVSEELRDRGLLTEK